MGFRFRHLVIALAALVGTPALTQAQSPQCDAWRGELARLDRSGAGAAASPNAARAAAQVGAQLGRAQAAYASLQCDGAWMFQAPPPQCGGLRAQIGQLRAQYNSLQQQAGGGPGNDNRRRALMAAIDDNCRPGVFRSQPIAPAPVQQPRTLFEALFGVPERLPPPPGMPELDGQPLDGFPEDRNASWGAGRPVCVRTCDGFFFPLANSPGGRESQSDMCQALCPAAETELMYMGGDGNIENAARRGGGTYSSIANAGKYLRQFDAACSCRKQGQSWAQALADAESLLERRRGDVLVTEQRAEEMSRARTTPRTRREVERQLRAQADVAPQAPASEVAADAAAARALEAMGRSAPTASTESSGIGPSSLGTGTVSANQGERRVVTNSAGETRTVRIVAPALTPPSLQ